MHPEATFGVVDDHPVVRRGIVDTLNDVSGFKVIGEGGTADDALQIAEVHKPDLIFLDVNMPGCGVAAARRIRTHHPQVRTVMFSFRRDLEIVKSSLEAGASGYIAKGVSADDLINAVRIILSGEIYLCAAIRDQLNRY